MSEKILSDILNHVSEIRKDVHVLDKKVEQQKSEINSDIERIHTLDEQQNQMLAEHMRRSDNLEKLYMNHREESLARLRALEEPRKFLNLAKKYLIGAGGMAGAAYAIYKLWELIQGPQ